MKKFSKLFLSCAAVAAVTAAVATSAMAAGISVEYQAASEGSSVANLKITADYDADQKTLLVLPKNVTLDNVSADDIVQIDQAESIVNVALPAEKSESNPDGLEAGDYTVYMGGGTQVYQADFHVGAGEKIVVGNVNGDSKGRIDGVDAVAVLKHANAAPGTANYLTGAKFQAAAQCNRLGDKRADGVDATYILKYSNNKNDQALADAGVGKEIVVSE